VLTPPIDIHLLTDCLVDEENDGRYEWLNQDYEDTDLKSGCDYKFRLSIQEDEDTVGESEYFVIVRQGDGGLTDDTMCPGPRGSEGDTVRYADLATQAAAQNENGDGGSSGSGDSSGSGGVINSQSDSVSTTTLIIAVVVSDIGIILLFVAVLLIGRRRSWFASRSYLATYLGMGHTVPEKFEQQDDNRTANLPAKVSGPHDVVPHNSYPHHNLQTPHTAQSTGGYGTSTGTGYTTRSEVDGRDLKIAQLE
jgi:hypothetical protein